MIAAWIPLTLGAAFLQNMRTALQRRATETLSIAGATVARFFFGLLPVALYLAALSALQHVAIPAPNPAFLAYAAVGGVGQILGNALLIRSFQYRNFLVATAYSKTEVAQTAIYSALWLGEAPAALAGLGIVVSMAGVIVLSLARGREALRAGLGGVLNGPALMGLGVGAGYALSTICYRAGALTLDHGDAALRAATTLIWVLGFQIVMMATYLLWKDAGEIVRVLRAWRVGAPIGLAGALSSVGWFTAMSLENVAYVRALGQIELLFTYLSSHHMFKERSNRQEILGIFLTVGGILLVLFGRD